jgi:hypothetical protein
MYPQDMSPDAATTSLVGTHNLAGTTFLNNLAGTPFFLKSGHECIKKGANAPLLREKRDYAKFSIPKRTNQVFLWYWYGKYQKNTNPYQPKIPT